MDSRKTAISLATSVDRLFNNTRAEAILRRPSGFRRLLAGRPNPNDIQIARNLKIVEHDFVIALLVEHRVDPTIRAWIDDQIISGWQALGAAGCERMLLRAGNLCLTLDCLTPRGGPTVYGMSLFSLLR